MKSTSREFTMVALSLMLLASILFGFSGNRTEAAQTPQTAHISIVAGASSLTSTAFSPDVVTVVIGVNNTVVWTNNDNVPHTATGSNFTAFDTGNIGPGSTGSFTFTKPGTYPYDCTYHLNMVGRIIVVGTALATTTSSSQTSSGLGSSASGGIPEFPYQFAAMTVFTVLLILAYLGVRHQVINPRVLPS